MKHGFLYHNSSNSSFLLLLSPFNVVKMTRLRQAKEEAEREIVQYRSYLEAEYQKNLSQVCFINMFDRLFLSTIQGHF